MLSRQVKDKETLFHIFSETQIKKIICQGNCPKST